MIDLKKSSAHLSLCEQAENITLENLPEFFCQLHNRRKPHNAEYEILLLKEAAETLGMKLWPLFLEYQEEIGEKLPDLTELAWQLSFPAFYNLTIFNRQPGTVFNFPEDRIQKKKRGRKPNKIHQLEEQWKNKGENVNNVIRLQNITGNRH